MEGISTEGRIFARAARRETSRVERAAAQALNGTSTWQSAMDKLAHALNDEKSPVKDVKILQRAHKRLRDFVSSDEHGFRSVMATLHVTGKRTADLEIAFMRDGTHPAAAMAGVGERGLVVVRWRFVSGRRASGSATQLVSFVSDHALGRYFDRIDRMDLAPVDAFRFAMLCSLGTMAARKSNAYQSSLAVPVDNDLYAVGNMLLGSYESGGQVPWYDVRTVLTGDMLDEGQLAQAQVVFTNFTEDADVPSMQQVDNYVMRRLAESGESGQRVIF